MKYCDSQLSPDGSKMHLEMQQLLFIQNLYIYIWMLLVQMALLCAAMSDCFSSALSGCPGALCRQGCGCLFALFSPMGSFGWTMSPMMLSGTAVNRKTLVHHRRHSLGREPGPWEGLGTGGTRTTTSVRLRGRSNAGHGLVLN